MESMIKTRIAAIVAAFSMGAIALAGCSSPAAPEAEPTTSTEVATEAQPQSEAQPEAQPADGAWSKPMRDQFMNSCVSVSGQQEYCECSLAVMEEKYTADQMREEEKKMLSGESTVLADIQEELVSRCGDKIKQ